eukprot:763458-Hanusia_phi.AAC.1
MPCCDDNDVQMELDEFGQDDFDIKAWVNEQVRSSIALAEAAGHAKGSNADDHLSTLVVKLQLMGQSTNKSIDDSAVKLLSELPKVENDLTSTACAST